MGNGAAIQPTGQTAHRDVGWGMVQQYSQLDRPHNVMWDVGMVQHYSQLDRPHNVMWDVGMVQQYNRLDRPHNVMWDGEWCSNTANWTDRTM
ncbi:hypothetical protein ACOMHN_020000 [Nucella lapillus]